MVGKCNPEQRVELLAAAKSCTEKSGKVHDCYFKVMDLMGGAMEISKERQDMTNVLGNMVYGNNGEFSAVSLSCFNELYRRLAWYGQETVKVVIKGNNAIAFQMPGIPFSDLDIVVYINPTLAKDVFDKVYADVSVVCGQVISKHKQMIDRTFFRTRDGADTLFDASYKEAFVKTHVTEFDKVGATSCFISDDIRNASSSNSIYITASEVTPEKVVRIDMPHYDRAERVPLDFTPVFCSINDTIYKKSETDRVSHLALYRIKWGSLYEVTSSDSASESGGSTTASRMAADFIDISLLGQDDTELLDFASRGGFVRNSPLTTFRFWNGWRITCASINECVMDLMKGIELFDCPPTKKEKKAAMIKYISDYRVRC